ncbi:MAG: glycosyl hydrolase [Paenibacillus sp.]|nr:glycosyl hydrolase [Paenibacillus sp.]
MNPAWEPFEQLWDEFEHPLWQQYRAFGIRGGHGGMDYLC